MKKDGFTLVELLAVIAIIAILSVIIIPSIVTVNQNINTRLYSQKVENIESAAELYASNNPDIFNGADRVYITVHQLIEANYLEIDTKNGQGNCTGGIQNISNGCITDPRAEDENGNAISAANTIMNNKQILVVKKNVGVTATLEGTDESYNANEMTLVQAICQGFSSGRFLGYTDGNAQCECNSNSTKVVKKGTSTEVNSCIIVSKKESGDVDNWLKYGSTQANWRVLGLYKVDGMLLPKIITSDVVQ